MLDPCKAAPWISGANQLSSDESSASCDQHDTITITLWEEEYSASEWKYARKSPVKVINQQLQKEGEGKALSDVWGRSFQSEGAKATPELAASIQVWALVEKNKTKDILKKSGFSRLHISTRHKESTQSHHALVWVSSRDEALKAANLHPTHLGFVRTRRGIALRVPFEEHQAAFKVIHPDMVYQSIIKVNFLYKAQPIELGVTQATWEKMQPT